MRVVTQSTETIAEPGPSALAKQLKLKLQKGKQYEFTDPDGNADRLFVFHRDVEKARERLRKGDPPASR